MPGVHTQPASAFSTNRQGRLILVDPKNPLCRATQLVVRIDLLNDFDEPLAVDIEFQEYRHKDAVKWSHRIGRIAFKNTRGDTIYDVYVYYEYDPDVTIKMPPKCFGVTWADIKPKNGAKSIKEVNEDLAVIMTGRTIIGHGMRLDIKAIDEHLWDSVTVVDTQNLYGQVALSTLAAQYLGEAIQGTFHDPAEDAWATMLLYLRKHPYKGRHSFKEAEFELKEDDFPALGAPAKK